MITLYLLAGLLSLALICLGTSSLAAGGLLILFGPPAWRGKAASILLVPTLGAWFGVAGAWSLGALTARLAAWSAMPFWGWIGGLIGGVAVGATLGIILACSLSGRTLSLAKPRLDI